MLEESKSLKHEPLNPYRGTSLIPPPPFLGPYSRTIPRVIWEGGIPRCTPPCRHGAGRFGRGHHRVAPRRPPPGPGGPPLPAQEREFLIDNLPVRVHLIIVVIRWTGLAPWEFEFPFPGSLTSTSGSAPRMGSSCGNGALAPERRASPLHLSPIGK